ncbi:hypothetical protein ACIA5A_06035 [Micromonospora sp. NPDC051300]|uniref:hypothetical protein n=1 Tax=Micromonospora sp. NPDC051300 TaxID=3364286 RepID=UPI0037992A94
MALNADWLAVVDERIDQKNQRFTAVGTVADWAPPTVMVQFDGSALAVPVKAFGGISAGVGHRVGLMRFGTDWAVVGSFQSPTRGFIARSIRDSASATFTGTEVIVQSVTFTAEAAANYKVTAVQSIQSTVANDVGSVRLRWRNAKTLTPANSTVITQNIPAIAASGRGVITVCIGQISGVGGDVTVAVGMARDTGTGTLQSFGAVDRQENLLLVEAF